MDKNKTNSHEHEQEHEHERELGVLDLLLEQYENSEGESTFLDNLLFHQMYQELRKVDPDICDRVLTLACALCSEYGRSGYVAGLRHGAQLIAELTM